MSGTINCAVCNIKFTPFVDGQSTMCNKCHKEYLKSFNISELQNYNTEPKKQEQSKPVKSTKSGKHFYPPSSNFQYTLDTTKNEIPTENLSDLEKYHKSLKFHNRFHK